MKCYAGIGARKPPADIEETCGEIGAALGQFGYTLRSGGADGCDKAFEDGCNEVEGSKQIFLPWKNFNNNPSRRYLGAIIPKELEDIAAAIYPLWGYVSMAVKKLHARNVQQILGEHADDPSDFVVCYTERPYNEPKAIGGTMFGIVLATQHKIPVFNLFLPEAEEQFFDFLKTR